MDSEVGQLISDVGETPQDIQVGDRQILLFPRSSLTVFAIDNLIQGAIIVIAPALKTGLLSESEQELPNGVSWLDSRSVIHQKMGHVAGKSGGRQSGSDTYPVEDGRLTFAFNSTDGTAHSLMIDRLS